MASVINETQSTRLYDYNKIFGNVTKTFESKFELPKFTTYDQKETMMCVGYSLAIAGEIMFGKQMSPGWSYGKFRSHKKQGLYLEEALKYFSKQVLWRVGLPWWLSGKEPTCQFRRHEFNPYVRKIH